MLQVHLISSPFQQQSTQQNSVGDVCLTALREIVSLSYTTSQLIGATAHGAEDGEEGTRLADNIVPPTPTTVCMKRSPLAYSPHPIRASREENNPSTLIRGDNNLLDQWVGCHARMRWGEVRLGIAMVTANRDSIIHTYVWSN
uniref:Uncharacterized protein n=1 Tax=Mesocestoides corti TaxID=53468 RepID=A0A5K3EJ28_MESCO